MSVLLAVVSLLGAGCGKRQTAPEARITVSGAWALYPMMVKWAEEYRKSHPGIQIDISAGGAGKGMTDALSGAADIGMVSRDINPSEAGKGAWWVAVVKDAVIPVMNASNPNGGILAKRGLKKEEFTAIFVKGNVQDWSFAGGTPTPLHVYTRSDACGAAETWAKYLGAKQEDLKGTAVYGDPGVAEAVRKDVSGIGFNNLIFAYDIKSGQPLPGICVIPIDSNGNGAVDPGEDFYGTHKAVMQAIATGRYPSPPARDLNLVHHGPPPSGPVADFIKWVLAEGQAFVSEAGYIALPAEILNSQKAKLK
ncbi:MAG: substrate-binding domain-containing protein [bacterium]